jgi:regulator of sigma E protease
VKLFGEDMEDETQSSSPQAFFNKPIWQRAGVLFAGVVMNFVLGIFLFGLVYSYMGIPTKTNKIRIVEVVQNSPAETAGIEKESVAVRIVSEKKVYEFGNMDEFVETINGFKGKEIELVLEKDGVEKTIKITPRENPPVGEGALGVALSNIELVKFPWWQMPFRGAVVGTQEAVSWGKEITKNLYVLIAGVLTGKGVPKDVAGPVGIYQVSKEVYRIGWLAVLQFAGVLSVNLAILNIMPFPALDGGRIAFLAVEKVIGKKRKNKIEGYVHTVGMVFLLGLMVLITIRDVTRLIWK